MSDIPTDLPEPTPPTQRCAVYTRVSMDNAEDDKLVVGPNDILVRISAKGVFELICDLMQAHKTDWVSHIPDQTPRK